MSTPGGHRHEGDGWTVVVPVKALDRAKSRLSSALSPGARRELVLAMATDVLRTCLGAPAVRRVRVVSPDSEVETLAGLLGAEFVRDPGGVGHHRHDDPLNAALTAALVDIGGPAGVVTADLPELRPEHLSDILARAAVHPHSMVADHRGVGTTMAFWTGAAADRMSRFGPGSAERFRTDGGAIPLTVPAHASRDVDTPADLATLSARAVGPATAGVLRRGTVALPTRADGVSATMVS